MDDYENHGDPDDTIWVDLQPCDPRIKRGEPTCGLGVKSLSKAYSTPRSFGPQGHWNRFDPNWSSRFTWFDICSEALISMFQALMEYRQTLKIETLEIAWVNFLYAILKN